MAYTTGDTVNGLTCKELNLNTVVLDRSKNLYIKLQEHIKLDQIAAKNIRISLDKPIAFSK